MRIGEWRGRGAKRHEGAEADSPGFACKRSLATLSICLRLFSRTGFVRTLDAPRAKPNQYTPPRSGKGRNTNRLLVRTDQPQPPNTPPGQTTERCLQHAHGRQHASRPHPRDAPVTPTTKSFLPASRNRATAFSPDSTGIWLSKNTTAYLLSGTSSSSSWPCLVENDARSEGAEPRPPPSSMKRIPYDGDGIDGGYSDPGVRGARARAAAGPMIMSSATSPFSAVATWQPRRESMRLMSVRVSVSSSTTSTCRPGGTASGEGGVGCAWAGVFTAVEPSGSAPLDCLTRMGVGPKDICGRWPRAMNVVVDAVEEAMLDVYAGAGVSVPDPGTGSSGGSSVVGEGIPSPGNSASLIVRVMTAWLSPDLDSSTSPPAVRSVA